MPLFELLMPHCICAIDATSKLWFELLRAQRTRLRLQLDGGAIDIQGWTDKQAQRKAGGRPEQRLSESERRGRRDLTVTLLVDISGSTDGWVLGALPGDRCGARCPIEGVRCVGGAR